MKSFASCLLFNNHPQSRYQVFTKTGLFKLRYFSMSSQDLCNTEGKTDFIEDSEELLKEQLRIDKIRNKSRLREDHHNIMQNKVPYSEPKAEHHLTVRYHRQMFGRYGLESGVNPGISWPTKEEIEERLSFEKVAYPLTIQELVKAAEKDIQDRELEVKQKHDRVMANMAKLNLWKKELNEKIAKRQAEALAVKEKKEKLIEEVRRHFGYKVDPRDEKFKEMLAAKEKEQKKKDKQIRMEEREKKALAKLMSRSDVNIPQNPTNNSDTVTKS